MPRYLTAVLVIIALPALAQEDLPDHERAEEAVAQGMFLSLADVLARLARTHPGEAIEVELDDEDGVTVYDLGLITADGRLLEIEVNARTGEVLDVEFDNDDDDDDDDDDDQAEAGDDVN